MPRPTTTSQWNLDQGSRSSRGDPGLDGRVRERRTGRRRHPRAVASQNRASAVALACRLLGHRYRFGRTARPAPTAARAAAAPAATKETRRRRTPPATRRRSTARIATTSAVARRSSGSCRLRRLSTACAGAERRRGRGHRAALVDEILARRVDAWIADDPDAASRAELRALLERGAGELATASAPRLTSARRAGGRLRAGPNRMNRAVGAARRRRPGPPTSARAAPSSIGYDARHGSRAFAQRQRGRARRRRPARRPAAARRCRRRSWPSRCATSAPTPA